MRSPSSRGTSPGCKVRSTVCLDVEQTPPKGYERNETPNHSQRHSVSPGYRYNDVPIIQEPVRHQSQLGYDYFADISDKSIASIRNSYIDHVVDSGKSRRRDISGDRGSVNPGSRYEIPQSRRPRRRRSPVSTRPRERSQDVYPRGNEDVVVGYIYRARQQLREGHRRQEVIDRATLEGRSRTSGFLAEEEAARYYHDDWANVEPERGRSRWRIHGRSYRSDSYQGPEQGDSMVSYRTGRSPGCPQWDLIS